MERCIQVLKTVSKTIGCVIVLLLTYLTTLPVERRWAEPEIWMTAGTGVLYVAGGVMTAALRKKMRVTVTDTVVLIWFAFYDGMTWADGGGYPCRTEFLHAAVVFLLYFSLRLLSGVAVVPAWMLVGCVIAGGCYEAVTGVSQMMNGTSRHSQYLLTGNFLNPGPYSAYLMMGIAVGLAAIQEAGSRRLVRTVPPGLPRQLAMVAERTELRHVLWAAVLMMAIVLPATWSRAAFAGIGIVCLWTYRRHYWRYRYAVWGLLMAAAISLYLVKQGSADGRMITWRAALTVWADSPWLGTGTGGLCHAVAEGIARMSQDGADLSSAGVTDNAYNILLKILVEHGVAGAVLAVTLCVAAMRSLRRSCRPLFYGMAALLIFSMFSYPFDLLPYKIIAVMTVAWGEAAGGRTLHEAGRIKTLLMAGLLAFAARQTYGLVRESSEADKAYSVFSGSHSDAFIEDYYELLTLEGDNADFLFDFGKTLREAGRYNDSNDILRRGMLCSADPMFYVLTGNNYKDMSCHDLAEQAYRKAFAVMPNRIYPLYQLLLLYEETYDPIMVEITAKRIIGMKPKVESEATRDMKREAQEALGKDWMSPEDKELVKALREHDEQQREEQNYLYYWKIFHADGTYEVEEMSDDYYIRPARRRR